ncbi:MAG: tetratricopeptide repeat protein [Pseudomonadota bacterium]
MIFAVLFGSALTGISKQVWSQENVTVRGANHPQYSRLVFDWDKAPSYKVAKSADSLTITFNKGSISDLSGINNKSLRNIAGVSSQGNSVRASIDADAKFRHFKIGQRIIVDVYNAKGTAVKQTSVDQKKPKPQKTKEDIQKVAKQGQEIIVDQPAPPVLSQPLTSKQPIMDEAHVITFSATKSAGMAVFERENKLWLVIDDPSLSIPPQLSGAQKEKFSDFTRFDIPGGIAYRMDLPQGLNIYAEGGGLLWRVILTPNPRNRAPKEPITSVDRPGGIGGGTVKWPIIQPRKELLVEDPDLKDTIHVVTVEDSAQYGGETRDYVDMQVLKSSVGLAVVPRVDDLSVSLRPDGVVLSKAGGLSVSSPRDTAPILLKEQINSEEDNLNEFGEAPPVQTPLKKIYNFGSWQMGGPQALDDNRRVLMSSIGDKDGFGKVEDLLTLAKLYTANNRGLEALGILRVAESELAGIDQNPEFIALRGAAATLADQYDIAIPNLFDEELNSFSEINIWKAAALAGLEDWSQAADVMPDNLDLVATYPEQVRYDIALKLAETALRNADVNTADSMLSLIDTEDKNANSGVVAGYQYLAGEADRQKGDAERAAEAWEELKKGWDDYYRAKSALSLTRLQLEEKTITFSEAINRLEALRYAWRGDELETLVNYRLGQVYVDNKDYLKGLSVLRNAISLSPDAIITKEVTRYMTDTFRSLFLEGKLDEISTLDAVSIYDEFKELTPAGSEGDLFIQKLAENLVSVDLLGRAADLLDNQVTRRLEGEEKVRVGLRLAAIRLLDSKPDGALRTLNVVDETITQVALNSDNAMSEERAEHQLLMARALSQLNRTGEAVEILNELTKRRGNDLNIARLKADIAWRAGRWDDAAEAFQDLIFAENISLTRPATDDQRDLLMNRAIALNLAGDRVGLANLREKFGDVMKQSSKARLFELVTRPRQMGLLGSRDSVESLISEVDLFGQFLESYRTVDQSL